MSLESWVLAVTIAIVCSRDFTSGIRNRGLHINNRRFDEKLIVNSEIDYRVLYAQALVCDRLYMQQMRAHMRAHSFHVKTRICTGGSE